MVFKETGLCNRKPTGNTLNNIFLSKYREVIFVALLPVFFYLAVTLLVKTDFPSICIFKAITGHECWGCGITRAFYALFHMQINKAYELNPKIIIVAPLFLYIWATTLNKSILRTKIMSEKTCTRKERG